MKVKYRDFVRQACKHVRSGNTIQVFDGEGVMLGSWIPSTKASIVQEKPEDIELKLKQAEEELKNRKKCEVCNLARPEYKGTSWQDGEEYEYEICGKCYQQHKPKGFKKIV